MKPHAPIIGPNKLHKYRFCVWPITNIHLLHAGEGNMKNYSPKSIIFPEGSTGLVYSPSLNGYFCIYCFLFGSEDLGVFVIKTSFRHGPCTWQTYKTFWERWKRTKKNHEFAMEKALNFLGVIEYQRWHSYNIKNEKHKSSKEKSWNCVFCC